MIEVGLICSILSSFYSVMEHYVPVESPTWVPSTHHFVQQQYLIPFQTHHLVYLIRSRRSCKSFIPIQAGIKHSAVSSNPPLGRSCFLIIERFLFNGQCLVMILSDHFFTAFKPSSSFVNFWSWINYIRYFILLPSFSRRILRAGPCRESKSTMLKQLPDLLSSRVLLIMQTTPMILLKPHIYKNFEL